METKPEEIIRYKTNKWEFENDKEISMIYSC